MSGKMRGLGRGLGSLLPDNDSSVSGSISTVRVEYIKPNRFQPRKIFDPEKLTELSESIRENGLIQPVVVVRLNDNEYELIAGERRLEACKQIGIEEIPAYIKDVTEKERLVLAIVENVQREDLSPIEEARAYQQLIDEFELTHLDISKIMSKDRATITNILRLLKLSESIQAMVEERKISPGHARAILSVAEDQQEKFAQEIVENQYTVRTAEEISKNYNETKPKKETTPKSKVYDTQYLKDIEKQVKQAMGFPVKIIEKKNAKGEIVINFANKEELETILNMIKGKDVPS